MNTTSLTPTEFSTYLLLLNQMTTVKPGTQLEEELLTQIWALEDDLNDDEIAYLSTL